MLNVFFFNWLFFLSLRTNQNRVASVNSVLTLAWDYWFFFFCCINRYLIKFAVSCANTIGWPTCVHTVFIRIIHKPLGIGIFLSTRWTDHVIGAWHTDFIYSVTLFISILRYEIQTFLLSLSLQPGKKEWNRGYRYIESPLRLRIYLKNI